MSMVHSIALVAAFALICVGSAFGQTKDALNLDTAPPKEIADYH